MRKVLLLAALAMAATIVFAPAVLAQGVSPEAGTGNPYGCPDEAPFVATLAGDPGEGSLRCFATQAEADAYSSGEAPASPDASASGCTTSPAGDGESVTVCVDPAGSPIASTTGGPLTPLPSDDGSSSPSASATATPTASVLPETGGPSSAAFSIVALGLLVGTGIMALGLVRRS